jgi:DNA-binding IclR family transcriptional regulator
MGKSESCLSGVRNALRVLDVFSEESQILGVSEIARRLGLPKSTTSRLVATLFSAGFLTAAECGKYRLGLRLVDRGLLAVQSHDLHDAVSRVLANLRAATGFSVHFAVLDGSKLMQTQRLTSNDLARMGNTRATPPIHATSTGKAILAFSEPSLLELTMSSRLKAFTSATITRPEALQSAVNMAKVDGYAFSRDEYMNGISGVAAPILDKSGLAVGAISIIALTHQMTERTRMHAKTLLLKSARSITVGAFN